MEAKEKTTQPVEKRQRLLQQSVWAWTEMLTSEKEKA